MAVAFVQKALNSSQVAVTSITATFGAGVSSGNFVIGTITDGLSSTLSLTAITDGHGNNPTAFIDNVFEAGGPFGTATFYYANVTNGATAFTYSTPTAPGFTGIEVQEWSGVALSSPIDAHNIALSASSTTQTTPTITTSANGDGIYASLAGTTTGFSNPSAAGGTGATFTLRNVDVSQSLVDDSSAVQASAGNVNGTFTLSVAERYMAAIVAFKAAGGATNPFTSGTRTYDLPNKGFVYSKWPDWQEPGNTILPARDLTKPSAIQKDFPNPRDFQRLPSYSWTEAGNVQLPFPTPFRPFDYPNSVRTTWYRSIEGSGNSLTAITHNPFFQSDWPVPQRVTWYQSWTESFNLTNPFRQLDWPLPETEPPIQQFWSQSLNLFYQSETFPFVQNDYPNLQRVTWYRDWSQNLQETTLAPSFQAPFNQFDWPLPRTYTPIPQFWAEAGNVQLPFPTPFFQNVDFPLPVVSQPIDATWIQNLSEFLQSNTFPFSQTDWKNPYPLYWYRDHNQNLVIYLPVGIKPFSQTDWPLPKTTQPIDQSYWQSLALNLPTPPPPLVITSAGRWISPEEVISSIARKYGSIGGLASANSRTAAERSLLASIAAAHRWKK